MQISDSHGTYGTWIQWPYLNHLSYRKQIKLVLDTLHIKLATRIINYFQNNILYSFTLSLFIYSYVANVDVCYVSIKTCFVCEVSTGNKRDMDVNVHAWFTSNQYRATAHIELIIQISTWTTPNNTTAGVFEYYFFLFLTKHLYAETRIMFFFYCVFNEESLRWTLNKIKVSSSDH